MIIEHNGESYIRLSSLYEAVAKPCIMAPFFGVLLPVIVRRLTSYAEIRACGDFSLIQTTQDIIRAQTRKLTTKEMVDYNEVQFQIIKRSLVNPTYDEIMSLSEYDVLRVNAEKELIELEDIINDMAPSAEKNELKEKYYITKMNSQYLLPADFVSFIMKFALEQDNSDIKDVTEDMLFEAALLSTYGGGSGSIADNLPGNFNKFNKVDINKRGKVIFYQKKAEHGSSN